MFRKLTNRSHTIVRWLDKASPSILSLYTALTVFSFYTCIYAFRKTFTVTIFEGIQYWNVDYKIWLVVFQTIGYGASKFVGIKVISELKANQRIMGILIMTFVAGMSWFFFAIVPRPYNIIFLFTNGFPLGLVWGMVFGFIEGRRNTDFLSAALAVSFIFSGGLCKSVGGYILRDWHISESWIPFVVAIFFLLPLLFFLWLLHHVPPPTAIDEQFRTKRQPMTNTDRVYFITQFYIGLIFLIGLYVLLTIFRDFRDNYSAEIWKSLGYDPKIFVTTEVPISLACLLLITAVGLVKNNYKVLKILHFLILTGFILIGAASYSYEQHWLNAPVWMTLIGFGLFLGYIPFNSSFFDRLLATFQVSGTVGFLIYTADSVGYLGTIGVIFYKNFAHQKMSWLNFFIYGSYWIASIGFIFCLSSLIYFRHKHAKMHFKSQKLL